MYWLSIMIVLCCFDMILQEMNDRKMDIDYGALDGEYLLVIM